MKTVDYTAFHPELFAKMTRQGAFLTTKGADGQINTMTIGWGSIGYYWRKPVFTCVVRQSRYSDKMISENPVFTVSVPKGDGLDQALKICGTTSGRDGDKFAACSLTAQPGQVVDCPVIGEAWLHFECKIVAKTLLSEDCLDPEIMGTWYKDHDMHVAYYGEIVACYENE